MHDHDDAPPRPGNGLAVTALVFGILGILIPIFVFATVALVLGIIALVKGQGKGMSITAIVLAGIGIIFVPFVAAIILAIAIPNLLERRVADNEAATRATLKSAILPAQVQFRGGAYLDQDGDGVGEYGLLSELAGRRPVGDAAAGAIRLLQGPLASDPGSIANGYRYAIHLPDGRGGALGEPAEGGHRPSLTTASDAQERSFVVYAWPLSADQGRRVFALTADGQVRSPSTGSDAVAPLADEPAWNAVFAGQGWDAEPAWPVYGK